MKEKIKNLSNKKIVITTLCAFAIILLLGFTYAYWSRTFNQTGENISTYDCFDISFSENTDGISMENGYPISDEEGLQNEGYEVTIRNTCNTPATYNVVLNKLNTSTLDDSHVKIAVDSDIKLLSETKNTTSTISNASEAKIISNGVLAGGQERTIQVQNWMDASTSESDGANKTFSYKITIEALASKNDLNSIILTNNEVKSETPNFKYGEPSTTITNSGSGLYKTEDDDGDSYYFRGNITNNYIEFGTYKEKIDLYTIGKGQENEYTYTSLEDAVADCNDLYNSDYNYKSAQACIDDIRSINAGEPIIWRIVRVNGDGTIRLISQESVGTSDYSKSNLEEEAAGYTYNNSAPNAGDGESNTIKTYLDNWYNINLKSLDNKIAQTTYCNDTSYTENENSTSSYSINYGSYNRIVATNEPSLKCPNTTLNYGGKYSLKIGLLSADELNFAGYGNEGKNNATTSDNYLYTKNAYWVLSPEYYTLGYGPSQFYASQGRLKGNRVHNLYEVEVRPVINLKANIKIASGSGTKNNPYVVE